MSDFDRYTQLPCGCRHTLCIGHAFSFSGTTPPPPPGWHFAVALRPDSSWWKAPECKKHDSNGDEHP